MKHQLIHMKHKNGRLLNYLLGNNFFNRVVENFSELLRKVNILDILNLVNFWKIFVVMQNTEILIESNFWLGMYVPYVLEWLISEISRLERTNFDSWVLLSESFQMELIEGRFWLGRWSSLAKWNDDILRITRLEFLILNLTVVRKFDGARAFESLRATQRSRKKESMCLNSGEI